MHFFPVFSDFSFSKGPRFGIRYNSHPKLVPEFGARVEANNIHVFCQPEIVTAQL
jgi:hypothetical protein